jgi:phosphoserine phosphatase
LSPGPFRLALFDLDGTLTRPRSSWQYLHERLGCWRGQGEFFWQRYRQGDIDYLTFCELDASLWRGLTVAELRRLVQEVPFYEGVPDLIRHLKSRGLKLALISSGVDLVAQGAKARLGFHFAVANGLEVAAGRLTGQVRLRVQHDKKGLWAEKLLDRWHLSAQEVMAFGDGPSDLELFDLAGFSVAINPEPAELALRVDLSFWGHDLRGLLDRLPV